MKKRNDEYLFVDGYNVINSWDIFKDKLDDLEYARDTLIEIMLEYQRYTKIIVTVVFDAYMVKGNSGYVESKDGLNIVFTEENQTADNYIERRLSELGKHKKVRVATSDRMEQQIILGMGGIRISARELESEIYYQNKLIRRRMSQTKLKNKKSIGNLSEKNLKTLEEFLKN